MRYTKEKAYSERASCKVDTFHIVKQVKQALQRGCYRTSRACFDSCDRGVKDMLLLYSISESLSPVLEHPTLVLGDS